MLFQGNAAYELAYQDVLDTPVREPLSVHQGGGLDARSHTEAMSSLSRVIKIAIAVTFIFVVFGGARVALTTQTVQTLQDVRTVRDTLAEANDTQTQLEIERSALLSTDRIQKIATESYGMVYASEVDTISIDAGSVQDSASAESATPSATTADEAGAVGSQPMAKVQS